MVSSEHLVSILQHALTYCIFGSFQKVLVHYKSKSDVVSARSFFRQMIKQGYLFNIFVTSKNYLLLYLGDAGFTLIMQMNLFNVMHSGKGWGCINCYCWTYNTKHDNDSKKLWTDTKQLLCCKIQICCSFFCSNVKKCS